MNELVYTIWLSLACTPSTKTFKKLLERFKSPAEIFSASDSAIAALIGSESRDYKALVDKSLDDAERILDFCTEKKVGLLSYFDSEKYPVALRGIKSPPVLLYYRGKLPDFNSREFISVVGTRKLSDYGKKNAFALAYDLARAGAVIVSGMAIGVDGVALAGALAAGGTTVAIIGSGIDVCYPAQHKRLAREIVKCGCVMTEYAPGTKPLRHNFPRRNRIISGLSSATVVIEGREQSGSVITARQAMDEGRRVYALPGSVGNENSEAANLLIKSGARLFTSADDIVSDYEKDKSGALNPFALKERAVYDINSTLYELEIACVTQSDSVFNPPRANKSARKKTAPSPDAASDTQKSEESAGNLLQGFDEATFSLYKKIPIDSDCSVEQLVDEKHTLPEVMQGLLRLEIARCVQMLPGDRVKRNL